jgi:hypothetical protein
MAYKLILHRPNGKPSATLTTTSAPLVAATIQGWLGYAPAEWFDEHGELTVAITHNGQPIDTAVLTEHIERSVDLTGNDKAVDAARRHNPKAGEQ